MRIISTFILTLLLTSVAMGQALMPNSYKITWDDPNIASTVSSYDVIAMTTNSLPINEIDASIQITNAVATYRSATKTVLVSTLMNSKPYGTYSIYVRANSIDGISADWSTNYVVKYVSNPSSINNIRLTK